MKKPEDITEPVQPETLVQDSEFTLSGSKVKVQKINLPRLTLQMLPTCEGGIKQRRIWNPSLRGQIMKFGGHSFIVKAATGTRLYLLLVEVNEKESAE